MKFEIMYFFLTISTKFYFTKNTFSFTYIYLESFETFLTLNSVTIGRGTFSENLNHKIIYFISIIIKLFIMYHMFSNSSQSPLSYDVIKIIALY